MAKILVIDPNKEECKKISRIFKKLNYNVDTATDISKTVNGFDLVIIQSEVMENLNRTVSEIKKYNPNIPVIAVTKIRFNDILFKIEQLLDENKEKNKTVASESEILTEQQRQELWEKRQIALTKKRLVNIISDLLSKEDGRRKMEEGRF